MLIRIFVRAALPLLGRGRITHAQNYRTEQKVQLQNDQFYPINNVKRSNTRDIIDMEIRIFLRVFAYVGECVCVVANIVAQFILLA